MIKKKTHGHTVLHQPEKGITLQIGNLPIIADMLTFPFVCDFRVQYVALGGQVASLDPIVDRLLFAGFDYCMNLGGFSNISFEQNGQRVAFDICPVNTLLNHFAQKEGKVFDNEGRLAFFFSSRRRHTRSLRDWSSDVCSSD